MLGEYVLMMNEDYKVKYTMISRLRVRSFLFKALRQVPLMHVVPISCIYIWDCMLVIYVGIVGIPMCHVFSCIILVTRDLGRVLESFMSPLTCQVWG
jgi:hypothetical protein